MTAEAPTPVWSEQWTWTDGASVEELRERLSGIDAALAQENSLMADVMLRGERDRVRNRLAAMLLEDDDVVWDKYRRVVQDTQDGVAPQGLISSREELNELMGL
jgi:hypothetical protein